MNSDDAQEDRKWSSDHSSGSSEDLESILLELKAVERLLPIHEAQVIT